MTCILDKKLSELTDKMIITTKGDVNDIETIRIAGVPIILVTYREYSHNMEHRIMEIIK